MEELKIKKGDIFSYPGPCSKIIHNITFEEFLYEISIPNIFILLHKDNWKHNTETKYRLPAM